MSESVEKLQQDTCGNAQYSITIQTNMERALSDYPQTLGQ